MVMVKLFNVCMCMSLPPVSPAVCDFFATLLPSTIFSRLYPVDHSRVNEYGESFVETNKTKEHKD